MDDVSGQFDCACVCAHVFFRDVAWNQQLVVVVGFRFFSRAIRSVEALVNSGLPYFDNLFAIDLHAYIYAGYYHGIH